MASLLSTRLPDGVNVNRGYNDRGCAASCFILRLLYLMPPLSRSPSARWTNFERAEGQLIKPDGLCIDIGLFTVDKACEEYPCNKAPLRIGGARFAERTVGELAEQGSYINSGSRGLLGALVGRGRRAPLSPEAFADVLRTKQFTNG